MPETEALWELIKVLGYIVGGLFAVSAILPLITGD